MRNTKVCSVPSTLRAPLLLAAPAAAVRSAKVWIATPYRLVAAAANTLAHTPLPRGTAYVLMSGISLALLAQVAPK